MGQRPFGTFRKFIRFGGAAKDKDKIIRQIQNAYTDTTVKHLVRIDTIRRG